MRLRSALSFRSASFVGCPLNEREVARIGAALMLALRDGLKGCEDRLVEPFVSESRERPIWRVLADVVKHGGDASHVGGLRKHHAQRVQDVWRTRFVGLSSVCFTGDWLVQACSWLLRTSLLYPSNPSRLTSQTLGYADCIRDTACGSRRA